jgi:oxygen-independent coproporphyrinogen III oxidase
VTRGLWLSDDDQRRRAVITAIMCNELADAGELAPDRERLAGCVADGLVEVDGARLRLTPLGRMFRRNVAVCFDAYLGRPAQYSRTV